MEKIPAFKAVPDTGEPLLPDLDIDVGLLRVDRFIFEPAVAGERQVATLNGKVAIADRRAQISANAETIGGGGGQGNALKLVLDRSEGHTSELQSLMRISYAVFCLKKKNTKQIHNTI